MTKVDTIEYQVESQIRLAKRFPTGKEPLI